MEEPDDFEVIYYGIPIKLECYVDCDIQPEFYRMMFFNPEISARKAFHYLNDNFDQLPHLKLINKWACQIRLIKANCDTELKAMKLIVKTAIKVVKWGKRFSFPILGDIDEMAEYLNLPTELILAEMYSIILDTPCKLKDVGNFLEFYTSALTDGEIDVLLDKFSLLKKQEYEVGP